MNFGVLYINYVKSLYKDICTHVANCGVLSESFEPSRGIRQGCPLSANLFVIIVEAMAAAISQNPQIIGIKVGKKVCKISQYADDTCIYVTHDAVARATVVAWAITGNYLFKYLVIILFFSGPLFQITG